MREITPGTEGATMSTDGTTMRMIDRSVAMARGELLRRPFLTMDVPTGYALSYPVPRQSSAGVLLAHFVYGAPATPASGQPMLSRPRYWLLTPPRDAGVLLFADCHIHDFTTDGYVEATWPRPDLAVSSIAELQEMEQQLLSALDAFIDETFAEPASLPADVSSAVMLYDDLIHQLTPEPMTPFLQAISPVFWDWVATVRGE